ncbi:MAG TPA: hypothetical protein VFY45_12045 [Baekduia sp.]|nr:hypothetical protein [Baekduia sp.]
MNDHINHGIAGNVNAKNVIVGANGQINDSGESSLSLHLNALTEAIAAHEAPDDVKVQLTSEANDVAAELSNPAPDKAALLPRLVGIATLAGAASAVATAATNLLVALT